MKFDKIVIYMTTWFACWTILLLRPFLVKFCEKWFSKHLAWTTFVVQSVMGSPSFKLCDVTHLVCVTCMTTHDRDAIRWFKIKNWVAEIHWKSTENENCKLKWWFITPEGGVILHLVRIACDGWKNVMLSLLIHLQQWQIVLPSRGRMFYYFG